MVVSMRMREEGKGENSTQPRDVYTTPKERSHIDLAEMKGRFRLEFRLNADMFPLVSLDLPPLVPFFFSYAFGCMQIQTTFCLISLLDHAFLSLVLSTSNHI